MGQVVSKDTLELNVRGTIFEHSTLQPLPGASVRLLDEKEVLVSANVTQKNGQFLLPKIPSGTYTLKVSFMGYKEQAFTLKLPRKSGNFKVDDILMREEATMMKETVINGQMPEMTVVDDTVQYNADAFKLPDGAMVEELLKKLPGIVVDEDGNYTWNGKSISQILVDGKEFYGNNRELILKNLPAEIIDKVKAYDRQSDMSRITGIDDGNEKTVLDLAVKKNKKKGWIGNASGGYGTNDRYQGRGMANLFKGEQKFSAVASANNTDGNGMNNQQSGGLTLNYEKKKVLELNGGLTGKWNQGKSESSSNRQSFENKNAAYSNSYNRGSNHNNNYNLHLKVEWKPDTMTNILFQPEFSLGTGRSEGNNESASFRENPYEYPGISDPLAQVDSLAKKIGVNHRMGANHNESDNHSGSASLQINRKLHKPGRNVTLNLNGGFGANDDQGSQYSQVDYYRILAMSGSDSIYRKTQFNNSHGRNHSYGVRLSYTEPVGDRLYLQMSYRYNYRFTDHNRAVSSIFDPYNTQYGVTLDNFHQMSLYATPDVAQCNYTTNHYQNHDASLQLRMVRTRYRLTAGVNVQPQINQVDYNKGVKHYDVRRSVVNASPTINFRYRFSREEQLDFRYGGQTGQPSITNLIPDTLSNADPLNIRLGNPELKPSFTQNVEANYRKSITEFQRSLAASVQFHTTSNSVSNRTEYNEETGGRVSRPENINGNWNGNASFNYNSAFVGDQRFRWNTNTQGSMSNAVGYVYRSASKETLKNRTRGVHASEHLRFTFRNDWVEVNTDGSFRYNHSRNNNSSASNLDTYHFSYGASVMFQFPWNMTLGSDIHEQSRRGYSDQAMNTNELIWGADISQRLLPRKNLTISLRAHDILGQRDNVSRHISATNRSDTRTESVFSYWMLSINYRFGRFGGKRRRPDNENMEPHMELAHPAEM